MKKTSLYIEPRVDAALTRKAEANGISKAQLIRDALETAVEDAPRPRFVGIGMDVVDDGPTDLADNFDKYLAESNFGED